MQPNIGIMDSPFKKAPTALWDFEGLSLFSAPKPSYMIVISEI